MKESRPLFQRNIDLQARRDFNENWKQALWWKIGDISSERSVRPVSMRDDGLDLDLHLVL